MACNRLQGYLGPGFTGTGPGPKDAPKLLQYQILIPTRAQRERRRARIEQAKCARSIQPQVDAALKFLSLVVKNQRAVLYCRASTRRMEREGRLDDQIREARRLLAQFGVKVIAVFSGVESGKIGKPRPILKRAIAYARKYGVVLIALSRDRFLRPQSFNGKWEFDPPDQDDYEALVQIADGGSLANDLCP